MPYLLRFVAMSLCLAYGGAGKNSRGSDQRFMAVTAFAAADPPAADGTTAFVAAAASDASLTLLALQVRSAYAVAWAYKS